MKKNGSSKGKTNHKFVSQEALNVYIHLDTIDEKENENKDIFNLDNKNKNKNYNSEHKKIYSLFSSKGRSTKNIHEIKKTSIKKKSLFKSDKKLNFLINDGDDTKNQNSGKGLDLFRHIPAPFAEPRPKPRHAVCDAEDIFPAAEKRVYIPRQLIPFPVGHNSTFPKENKGSPPRRLLFSHSLLAAITFREKTLRRPSGDFQDLGTFSQSPRGGSNRRKSPSPPKSSSWRSENSARRPTGR